MCLLTFEKLFKKLEIIIKKVIRGFMKGERKMKKRVLALVFAAIVGLMVGNLYAAVSATTMDQWWDFATTGNIADGDGIIYPGANYAIYDVEFLGIDISGGNLNFALQTTFPVNGLASDQPGYVQGIHAGDFVLDLDGDGVKDAAIDFTINNIQSTSATEGKVAYGDVNYTLYYVGNNAPLSVWERGYYFDNYDPIGLTDDAREYWEENASEYVYVFEADGAYGVYDGNGANTPSYTLSGSFNLSDLPAGLLGSQGPVNMSWAMSCGNDGLTVAVPEPVSAISLVLGALGLYFRKRF